MLANDSSYSVPNASYAAVSGHFFNRYKTITGSLIFFLLFPFLLFNFKFVPIRPTLAAMCGAVLMVVFDVVTQKEAYAVIGLRHNLMTILLLLGMMLIGEYIEREQIVARFLRRFLPPEIGFAGFLFRSGSLVFVAAALFTSEGAAVLIAPVLLRCWKEHERAHVELETLLIAIATTANVGGASTYFGSVMLALISSKTHDAPYQNSLLDLRLCLKYLVLPAVLCFWVNYALLLLHFWVRSRRIPVCYGNCDQRRSEREPFGIAAGSDGGQSPGNGYLRRDQNEDFSYDSFVFREDRLVHPPTLETIIEDEVLELPETTAWGSEFDSSQIRGLDGGEENLEVESGDANEVILTSRLRSCSASEDLTVLSAEDSSDILVSQHSSPTNSIPSNPAVNSANAYVRHNEYTSMSGTSVHCSHSAYSMAEFFGNRLRLFEQESQWSSVILMIILTVVILAVTILLLASSTYVYFDPGLIPISGAFVLILVDSIVNRFAASFIIRRIDWSMIAVFSAVFVWMAGFNNTGVPRFVWEKLGFSHTTFDEGSSTAVFAAVLLLTGNTFGQVPVTVMVLDQLKPGFDQKRLVLYLAWVISIAGNLTPYSSAATVFVSSHSSQVLNYPMTLWSFARFGVPSSLLLVTLGLGVISLLLMSS